MLEKARETEDLFNTAARNIEESLYGIKLTKIQILKGASSKLEKTRSI
jgi:hypothetical protein